MKDRIELSTKDIKRLTKGKEITIGLYTLAPKATSYKDMVKELKLKVYNLRYQLKKARKA